MEVKHTDTFGKWLRGLKDLQARARIVKRLQRVEEGNFGDHAGVGGGVMELRIHYGPGYRVYYVQCGETLVIVLGGGDKSTQDADIAKAKALADEF